MARNYTTVQPYDEAAYDAGRARAIKANARKGRAQRWLAEDATRQGVIDFLDSKGRDDDGNFKPGFLGKMAESHDEWGNLTAGQEAAVRKIMAQDGEKKAQWAARDAKSGHLGTVGVRQQFTATVTFVTGFETQYGFLTITGLRDANDNVIVHKGRDWAEKGEVVTFMATVKEHGERNGVKQTIVTRPKVVVAKTAAALVQAVATQVAAPAAAEIEAAPAAEVDDDMAAITNAIKFNEVQS